MYKSNQVMPFTPVFLIKGVCLFFLKSFVILLFSFMLYLTYKHHFPSESDFKEQFSKELLVGYESDLNLGFSLYESCGSRVGWLTFEEVTELKKLDQWEKTIKSESMPDEVSRHFFNGINCDGGMTKEYYLLFYKAFITTGHLYIKGAQTLAVFLPEERLLLSLYYER